MTKVFETQAVAPIPKGLIDGGHIYLKCSNCNKDLVDIWITQPTAPFKWRAKAKCWNCGDESYWKDFKGRFAAAGFSKETTDEDYDNLTKLLAPEFKHPDPVTGVTDIIFPTAKGDKK